MKTQELRNLIREEVRKVLKEAKEASKQLNWNAIKPGDKITYIAPGTTNKTATGKVVSKDSTRTEDFLVIIDDKTKKKMNIMMSHVGSVNENSVQIKEGMDSKPIESFSEAKLKNILTKIGFPATKAEGYDDINGGPTLSVVFKNTLDDENEFMDAYADFQFDDEVLGSKLPDIQSADHVGGKKWKFQMEK